jgi:hypothetical protein
MYKRVYPLGLGELTQCPHPPGGSSSREELGRQLPQSKGSGVEPTRIGPKTIRVPSRSENMYIYICTYMCVFARVGGAVTVPSPPLPSAGLHPAGKWDDSSGPERFARQGRGYEDYRERIVADHGECRQGRHHQTK